MKAIIFAGGTGTRLWPLSRKKSPKQFEKLINNKSTLQLAVERLLPDFKYEDIYISTNYAYKEIIEEQLPKIPEKNFIFEPEKKDVAPAIALSISIIAKKNPLEPIVILWSDHLVKKVDAFRKIIKAGVSELKNDPNKIIFIAHKPRFANTNVGYIKYGKIKNRTGGFNFYSFESIKYRPDRKTAKEFIKLGNYAWNLGYFVTTPRFILDSYEKLAPEIFKNTESIVKEYRKSNYKKTLIERYGKVKSISFDNAILEKLKKEQALVIVEDIDWSDIGSWEALKEALQKEQKDNIIKGQVILKQSKDSLAYNYDDKKLIVGIDLKEHIIVNTKDVILIAKKASMSKVKELVEGFDKTEHEKYS